jgi:hypothetical protein
MRSVSDQFSLNPDPFTGSGSSLLLDTDPIRIRIQWDNSGSGPVLVYYFFPFGGLNLTCLDPDMDPNPLSQLNPDPIRI